MSVYEDWITTYGKRVQNRFKEIKAGYNFDFGPEFEIAIVELLRGFLPSRFGVCRGFVITEDDRKGDDIVIFDVGRFPTLRSLGDDLSIKDYVPADGVLAYVEAKHTLHVTKKGKQDVELATGDQSLRKACKQVSDVKTLPRGKVTHPLIREGKKPVGYPNYRNPFFGAVIARNVVIEEGKPEVTLASALKRIQSDVALLPDLIVGERLLALPMYGREKQDDPEARSPRPFLCPSTELITLSQTEEIVFGAGIAQLLWALEWIKLGQIPWNQIIAKSFPKNVSVGWGVPPISGKEE